MAQCGIGRLERSILYSLYPSCDHLVLSPVSPAIESHVRDVILIGHATTPIWRFLCVPCWSTLQAAHRTTSSRPGYHSPLQ
jgi:hypothetical protein